MVDTTAESVYQVFLRSFPHSPTSGQTELLRRLANFIIKSSGGDTYLMKGYAGTGKTTMVSALVKALPKFGTKTVLLAPTARAAKVMTNYSGKQAFTIHRKIYKPKMHDGNRVSYALAPNTHTDTLFIVDEASMIYDKSKQAELFNAQQNLLKDLLWYVEAGKNCRLLLIGDLAQLPPVGQPDSPALDIKKLSGYYGLRAGHFELTEVMRQEELSGILENATRLRLAISNRESDFKFQLFKDVERVHASDLPELLNACYSHPGPEEVVVICRSNRSANNYNRQIRFTGMWFEEELCAGDYIMCVKNNYYWLDETASVGFIANGDILKIQRIIRFEEKYGFRFADISVMLVDFPNQPAFEIKVILDSLYTESPALTATQSNQLYQEIINAHPEITSKTARAAMLAENSWYQSIQIKFAYAITCHKAQGGQWKKVFIDQGYLTEDMLDVNYLRWLYTAVTRGTENVYLVNFNERFFEER